EIVRNFTDFIRKEDKTHLLAFCLILLSSIFIRIYYLFHPMLYDEAFTFLAFASKPLYLGLSNYLFPNNHIFHTFFVHISYLLFGNVPWAIRLPALIAGILLVPASYMTIRILYDKYAALLTAALVGSSWILIEHSTHARGYTLLCLIFLLILTLSAHLVKSKDSDPATWLLFVMLSALGFYTIPIMFYPFGVVAAWLFLSIISQDKNPKKRFTLKIFFASMAGVIFLTLMLYFPVFVATGPGSVINNPFVQSYQMSVFLSDLPSFLRVVWHQWNMAIPVGLQFFLIIGFLISTVFHKKLCEYRIPLVLAAIIWLAPALLIQRIFGGPRIWLFLLPLYLGLASSGISYLLTRSIKSKPLHHKSIIAAILAVTLSFGLILNVVRTYSFYYSDHKKECGDAEQIAIFLKNNLKPEDIVVALKPINVPLQYYCELYGVPVSVQRLISKLDFSHRIFVVVNQGKTVKGILREAGFADTRSITSKIIQEFKFLTLYEISGSSFHP
ncbi:MAG: glycosyltransferase family 39 protein, partial [Candidatus Omnitrophota bacterium]